MTIGLVQPTNAPVIQTPAGGRSADVQPDDAMAFAKVEAQTNGVQMTDLEQGDRPGTGTDPPGPDRSSQPPGNADSTTAPNGAGLVEASYWEVFRHFALLGWTAFGGPSAHLALFQKIFVEKLRWISNTIFLELLALSQCIPGPSSTQVNFAIGIIKKGVTGGLLSGILFQYPGLLIMSLVGVGAANWLKDPEPWLRGLLAGLGAVGVALVAGSAVALTYGTCKERVTMAINGVSTVVAYYYSSAWIFPTLIVLGDAPVRITCTALEPAPTLLVPTMAGG